MRRLAAYIRLAFTLWKSVFLLPLAALGVILLANGQRLFGAAFVGIAIVGAIEAAKDVRAWFAES